MARRKGKAKGSKKPKSKTNGRHEAVSVGGNFKRAVKTFVGRIESLHSDLESEKGKYMNACKPIHDDIKEIYSEAKAEGIAPKALKVAVKIRDLERKKDKAREALEVPDQDELDRIRLALGDLESTPLGQAALATATVAFAPAATEQPSD